ncbi:uncharacterized protein LOC110443671 [Mizuhopecten yessoensis]|uniref:uncharacterized protein LOC110443671 n=1 Tax=Mizuhopecten yessoensis TaxID=6573 RepID=UPI000B45BA7F|nr:uncharacterized protein LOC110443671 [Mizuhopecten yessoensis]
MKTFARFSVLIMFLYVSIQILLFSRDVSYHPVPNIYRRYNLNSGENGIYDSQLVGIGSSEHPKSYKEVKQRHLSIKGHREISFAEENIVETLPANQTGRLLGIKAGKVVKVIGRNGSIESEQRIGKRYRLIRKLGEGSFGKVFLGTDVTSGESVAIKIEDTEITHPYLHEEEKVYRILEGGEGFPTVRWSGKDGSYNFLVTDLLGPSLYDYYHLFFRPDQKEDLQHMAISDAEFGLDSIAGPDDGEKEEEDRDR